MGELSKNPHLLGVWFGFAAVFLLSGFPFGIKAAEADILLTSDIHFNPFYQPELVEKLAQTKPENWEDIFEKNLVPHLSAYKEDTNYPLLKSSLLEMQKRDAHPDFMIISGDFLSHHFKEDAERLVGKGHKAFAALTIQFLAHEFQKYFPDTAIIPALGNNDSDCGDYRSTPNGKFLKNFIEAWAPSITLHSKETPEKLKQDFSSLGDYSIQSELSSHSSKIRFVVYNGVYESHEYKNECGDPKEKPADEEIAWLQKELETANKKGEDVWLVTHIPLGVNVYPSILKMNSAGDDLKKFCREKSDSRFLSEPYGAKLESLLNKYSSEIVASTAGHTHSNEFRIYSSKLITILTPSISPAHANNPSFAVMKYDADKKILKDEIFYSINLSSSKPEWKTEFDFDTEFKQPDLSVSSFEKISDDLKSSEKASKRFQSILTSGATVPEIISKHWSFYICGFSSLSDDDFFQCLCAH